MKNLNITNPKIFRTRILPQIKDPKLLGYVDTDGVIHYGSEEIRKLASKSICLKGPQCNPPHEIEVVSQGNCILYISKGDLSSVNIPNRYQKMPNAEIEHSHPNDTPLSYSDYKNFMNSEYKSLVAYTPDGRYSKITRLPRKEYPFFNDFFQNRDLNKMLEIAKRELGYAQRSFCRKTDWLYKVLEKKYDSKIVEQLEKKLIEYGQMMNIVWESWANRLGIKYENNLRETPKFSIFHKTINEILKFKEEKRKNPYGFMVK